VNQSPNGAEATEAGVRTPRVLLVDDDAGDQYLVRRALANDPRKADLLVIDDGDAALDYLLHRAGQQPAPPRPDLVLLDLNLPGSDGFSILSAVRAEARLESMPVIVISTSSRDEDIAQSYRLGCNAYVVKPESASTFIQVIHSVSNYWLGVDPTDRA
jgi:CheY-like chemotaxis protein